jgi:hypothetical protein
LQAGRRTERWRCAARPSWPALGKSGTRLARRPADRRQRIAGARVAPGLRPSDTTIGAQQACLSRTGHGCAARGWWGSVPRRRAPSERRGGAPRGERVDRKTRPRLARCGLEGSAPCGAPPPLSSCVARIGNIQSALAETEGEPGASNNTGDESRPRFSRSSPRKRGPRAKQHQVPAFAGTNGEKVSPK